MAVWFVAGGGHELGYCHLPLCAGDCQKSSAETDPDRPSLFLLRLFIMICIVSVRTVTAPPPPPPPPPHCHINNWPYCLDPQPKNLSREVQQNSGLLLHCQSSIRVRTRTAVILLTVLRSTDQEPGGSGAAGPWALVSRLSESVESPRSRWYMYVKYVTMSITYVTMSIYIRHWHVVMWASIS